MRRLCIMLLATFLVLATTAPLAPADARVNSGMSLGSRGTKTFAPPPGTASSPYGASPFQRSMTPNGSQYSSGAYGSPYGSRFGSSFGSGFLGGLIGVGLGSMLFGGMHGGLGVIGLLVRLAILFMIGNWIYRRFFAGSLAPAGAAAGAYARSYRPNPGPVPGMTRPGMFGGGGARRPLALAQADYQSFDQLLHNIQAAWSAHDLNGLRAMATPEMVGYFGEQLAEQVSRGVRNKVTDVRLMQGDLSEAWSEGAREYATVSMRFSMIDVTLDASGRVVDGSPNERVTVTEYWTFVRSAGGRWVLSAIQQAR